MGVEVGRLAGSRAYIEYIYTFYWGGVENKNNIQLINILPRCTYIDIVYICKEGEKKRERERDRETTLEYQVEGVISALR